MKKIIGISLVAMFAVSPMVARADVTPVTLDTTDDLATTSYVQGAYNDLAGHINTNVSAINTLNGSGAGSVANSVKTGAASADYTNASMTGITSISGALGNLDTRVDAVELEIGDTEYTGGSISAAIAGLQSDASGLGTGKVNQEGNFTAETDSDLIKTETVVNAIKNTATQVDTNTEGIADINQKVISVVKTWNGTAQQIKVSQLANYDPNKD